MQFFELLGFHRPIYVSPPHLIRASCFPNDEFVARGSSGVLPGADDKGSQVCKASFVASEGFFIQPWRREIPVNGVDVLNAVAFQAMVLRG